MNIYENIKKHKNINFIVFILISVFYLVGNLLWYKLNTPILVQGAYNNYFVTALIKCPFFCGITPLIIWIMKGFLYIFGNKYFDLEIIFINYFFFLIALYFINKICVEIKDKETGIMAMILFALTPCVYGASRQYGHHDYHIMCISLLNIYSLIKSKDFTNTKWSVIYGISIGIGLLAKDSFLAYFFGPFLYVFIKSLIGKTENKKQKIKNIIITILLGCLVAGCHYFSLETVIKILRDPFIEAHNPTYGFEELRIFTIGICEYLVSFPVFLLFLLGLFWFILNYKNIKYKYIFLLWLIIPWGILMNMPHHRQPDYGLGLIPVMIIIISLYISDIKKSVYKNILSIVLVAVCLIQYISFSYGINIGLSDLKINLKGYDFYYFYNQNRNAYYPNLVVYDRAKTKFGIAFSKYLRENFKDKKIYMYKDMRTRYFVMQEIDTLLILQNCKIILDVEEMLDADVIAFTKQESFIDSNYLFDVLEHEFSAHFVSFNKQDLEKKISSKIEEIRNNYIKLDEFDLNNNEINDQDHIIILGKKDLFENDGNKIKYKYTTDNFK